MFRRLRSRCHARSLILRRCRTDIADSKSIGKSETRSPARSEKSGNGPVDELPLTKYSCMASQKPWYGNEPSCSAHRPCSTVILRAFARFSSSSRSRDFPIPGSPPIATNWHSPATAELSLCCSSASSFAFPTNGESAGRGIMSMRVIATDFAKSLSRSRDETAADLGDFAPRCVASPGPFKTIKNYLSRFVHLRADQSRRLRNLVNDAIENRLVSPENGGSPTRHS